MAHIVEPLSPSARLTTSVLDLVRSAFPRDLRSLILTGSLARGEGTWFENASRYTLAGDAEFLLVFNEQVALPDSGQIADLQRKVESYLSTRCIDAKIGLSPVHPTYLKSLRPHIFAYELICRGKILCGDGRILDLIPKFDANDIPLEDGFRILMNRLIELTEAVCEGDQTASSLAKIRYRTLKLTLDMVTSYLVFVGGYRPTYEERAEQLRARFEPSEQRPLSERFVDRALAATRIKLSGVSESDLPASEGLLSILDEARVLWRWELQQMISRRIEATDRSLMQCWVASQSVRERLRGWASLIKRSGRPANPSQLLRWMTGIVAGSPRRLIYAVTSELCFALPAITSDPNCAQSSDSHWNYLRRHLPVPSLGLGSEVLPSWQRLGLAISTAYHRFLEDTRA